MTKLTTIAIIILISILNAVGQEQNTNIQKAVQKETTPQNDGLTINNDAYTLHLALDTAETDSPILVISITLHKGSYYISPNSKGENSGKFFMDLGTTTAIEFKGALLEYPLSKEVFENKQRVNWVKENTTYKQALQVKSLQDFEVFGRIKFTIEPRCTLEEIPFGISYKNGKYTITNPKC